MSEWRNCRQGSPVRRSQQRYLHKGTYKDESTWIKRPLNGGIWAKNATRVKVWLAWECWVLDCNSLQTVHPGWSEEGSFLPWDLSGDAFIIAGKITHMILAWSQTPQWVDLLPSSVLLTQNVYSFTSSWEQTGVNLWFVTGNKLKLQIMRYKTRIREQLNYQCFKKTEDPWNFLKTLLLQTETSSNLS